MQGGVRHGPQVDEEAELVASEILGQVHVGRASSGRSVNPCARMSVRVRVRVKEAGKFPPHVGAADSLVVDPVGHPVDCDIHFGNVGVEIVFGVPGARRVVVDEQQENSLE